MTEFQALPEKMQIQILKCCDTPTLAALCCTNREVSKKTLPLLWNHIDFEDTYEHLGPQRKFLMLCDDLSRQDPERWSRLGRMVRSLVLVKMPGINVTHKHEEDLTNADMEFIECSAETRNVYDIIAQFPQLETLSLFVKDFWGGDLVESVRALETHLTKLRTVKIGGEVVPCVLRALLSRPEQIQMLSLINLIYTPGQDYGPHPVLFLEPIQQRFTSLTHLHLSKLAELDENCWLAGLRWNWDVEQ